MRERSTWSDGKPSELVPAFLEVSCATQLTRKSPRTEPGTESTGLVSYRRRHYGAQAFCWEIGIALLPQWRGQGIGWRAQAIFCSYLFENTPVQRIEAATHAENTAEQRSLEKAGFTLEGVIRAAEYRAGQWRDGYLYSRLRTDPDPLAG